MSSNSNLLILNARGLIPGPVESEEHFLLRSTLSPTFSVVPSLEALQRVSKIFYMHPDWVEVVVSSRGLRPWEGAATWIEQSQDGKCSCRIQIKDSFLSRLYPKEEVIAHEMVHAMRLTFDEVRFEEILAYRTSTSAFRRYCGPLFTRSKETILFLVACLIPWLTWWGEIFLDRDMGATYLFFIPFAIFIWGIFRLVRSQRVFSLALKNLEKAMSKKGKALAVAVGLTDAEIELFSKSSRQEIYSYASTQKDKDVRWNQLFFCYFLND